jgi:hypothetical protein
MQPQAIYYNASKMHLKAIGNSYKRQIAYWEITAGSLEVPSKVVKKCQVM